MWQTDVEPTLSIEMLCKMSGRPAAEVKAAIEERERILDAREERREIQHAATRAKMGPYRVNEALGDAFPEITMGRRRFVKLHRASMHERGCKGGELLSEDSDLTAWILKQERYAHLRTPLAKNMSTVSMSMPGSNSLANRKLANAAEWGRREREGRTLINPITKGYFE